jgi:hypothetical protein
MHYREYPAERVAHSKYLLCRITNERHRPHCILATVQHRIADGMICCTAADQGPCSALVSFTF